MIMTGRRSRDIAAEKIITEPIAPPLKYFDSKYLSMWFVMLQNIGGRSAIRNQFMVLII